MLKKLIRYDMRYFCRVLPKVFAAIIVFVTALTLIFTGMAEKQDSAIKIILTSILYNPIVFIAAFASVILAQIIIMVRIYKNMFSREGYLTFTLPATNRELIVSKLVSCGVWYYFAAILLAFCLYCIFITSKLTMFGSDSFLFEIAKTVSDWWGTLGIKTWQIALYAAIFAALSSIYNAAASLLAFSVGQLAAKSRVIAGIGVYIGITDAVTIVNIVIASVLIFALKVPFLALISFPIVMCAAALLFIYLSDKLMKTKLNLV